MTIICSCDFVGITDPGDIVICPIDLAILFVFVVFIIGTIIFIYRIFKPRGCFHSDHIVDQIHPVENKKGDVK